MRPRREEQADEVETRFSADDPALVLWLYLVCEDGQVNPGEVGTEPRAPDDIGHLQGPLILEDREPVSHANDLGDSFDPGSGEVLGFDSYDRSGVTEESGSHSASDRGVHGEHAVKHQHHQRHSDTPPDRGVEDTPNVSLDYVGFKPRCLLNSTRFCVWPI